MSILDVEAELEPGEPGAVHIEGIGLLSVEQAQTLAWDLDRAIGQAIDHNEAQRGTASERLDYMRAVA